MKVGYCVPITPQMASYRLRVAIPAPLLGCEYELGTIGQPSFFYKHFEADLELARSCGPFVYDVVNDHFGGALGRHYRSMCELAAKITCPSPAMAERIGKAIGRDATVIDDPYENEESSAQCTGRKLLWFGHSANISSLFKELEKLGAVDAELEVCTNFQHQHATPWSPDNERRCLASCSLVLVTGNNYCASANRIIKALRAGRFVVTPGGVPAWDALKDYIWVGDIRKGIEWAFNNRDEVCAKITAGQAFSKVENDPRQIAAKWTELFGSISEPATSGNRDGLASICTMDTSAVQNIQ